MAVHNHLQNSLDRADAHLQEIGLTLTKSKVASLAYRPSKCLLPIRAQLPVHTPILVPTVPRLRVNGKF